MLEKFCETDSNAFKTFCGNKKKSLPFSSPAALPVYEQHSGCDCVQMRQGGSLTPGSTERRRTDTHTFRRSTRRRDIQLCWHKILYDTSRCVCVCFSQLRSAGGRSEHREMPWSSLLDLNHLYQQRNVLFRCPDHDGASGCESMLYCWRMRRWCCHPVS